MHLSSRRLQQLTILALASVLVLTAFSLTPALSIPAVGAVSVQPFHLNNNFNYTLTPCETFTTHGPTPGGSCTGAYGNEAWTETACTDNFRVNQVIVSWTFPDKSVAFVDTFSVSGSPGQNTCVSSTHNLSAIGNYTIVAKFYAPNPLPCCPHEDLKGVSIAKIDATAFVPEFPIGAIIGVVAPIAALIGYVQFGRKRTITI